MKTVKIIKFSPNLCNGCLECEKACSNIHFRVKTGGEKSAIRIIKKENSYEMTNCNQCGLCIDLCPVEALKRMKNGAVILNKNICVGCQSCVAFCPGQVVRKAADIMVPFKCISCGACVKACPEGALELVEVNVSDVEEVVYHAQGASE